MSKYSAAQTTVRYCKSADIPALTTSLPPEQVRARGTLNLTNTGSRLVNGTGKQVEGEVRAAEERPVLRESREFSAVWVLAKLEVDSVRCSLGHRDVE
ncbi:hypothetical protein E2C01_093473 [Portunus trituberculatus]|uniref:Uncharacterized protein n=1 Tax=Portunus trituberculatus TaxID=210409 RepID=A0A5B7JMT8_PORTR|nr:hypothetical protein [Portunus trituberculatus]